MERLSGCLSIWNEDDVLSPFCLVYTHFVCSAEKKKKIDESFLISKGNNSPYSQFIHALCVCLSNQIASIECKLNSFALVYCKRRLAEGNPWFCPTTKPLWRTIEHIFEYMHSEFKYAIESNRKERTLCTSCTSPGIVTLHINCYSGAQSSQWFFVTFGWQVDIRRQMSFVDLWRGCTVQDFHGRHFFFFFHQKIYMFFFVNM